MVSDHSLHIIKSFDFSHHCPKWWSPLMHETNSSSGLSNAALPPKRYRN